MCYLDITPKQIIWPVKLSKPSYGNVIVFLVNTIIPKTGGMCSWCNLANSLSDRPN